MNLIPNYNSLPNELVHRIYNNVDLYDKTINFPLVCVRWNEAIEKETHEKNLIILSIEIFKRFKSLFPFYEGKSAFPCYMEFNKESKRQLFNFIINSEYSKLNDFKLEFNEIHSQVFNLSFNKQTLSLNQDNSEIHSQSCIQKNFSTYTYSDSSFIRNFVNFDLLIHEKYDSQFPDEKENSFAVHTLNFHLKRKIRCIADFNLECLSHINSGTELPSKLYHNDEGSISNKPYNELFSLVLKVIEYKRMDCIFWYSLEIENEKDVELKSFKLSQLVRWCALSETMNKLAERLNMSVKIFPEICLKEWD